MIVKNESHIILETLQNILNFIPITYWVISDTGSTDNTIQLISTFFYTKNIPGELFQDEWIDFGHNRSKAIQHAYGKSDYLFIFDADDLIVGNLSLPTQLNCDIYHFNFDNYYTRGILVNNKKKWLYKGVLHEYIVNIDDICGSQQIVGDYYINSRRIGSRNKQPNKYLNDAIILENAYNNEFNDLFLKHRYLYYCGQSYKDAMIFDKAIEFFEKYINEKHNNIQYKYCACINAGNCYKLLNDNENAILLWSKAHFFDNSRIEHIVNIMEYYYNKNVHFMVNSLYNQFKNHHVFSSNDMSKIFLNTSKYHYFHYFNSISAYYVNDFQGGYDSCKYLLFNDSFKSITISNFVFYAQLLSQDNSTTISKILNIIFDYIYSLDNHDDKTKLICSYEKFFHLFNPDLFERLKNMNIINLKQLNSNKINTTEHSNNILIYTGFCYNNWNDSYMKKHALGGSEKAVAYLARELSQDYNVFISGDVDDERIDNVIYINRHKLNDLLISTFFDTIIVSRYISFFLLFPIFKCKKLILSAHDTCFLNNISNSNISSDLILKIVIPFVDNIVVLTNWQKDFFKNKYPFINDNKYKIINNGIPINEFPIVTTKIKNSFIFSSCYSRGLERVIQLWNDILIYFPDATLHICSYDHDPNFKYSFDKYTNIICHGKLDFNQLYHLMSTTEYWLYPTSFSETSCITGLEMLMNEVICLYYPIAGLVDTIGCYGIQIQNGNEIHTILNLTDIQKTELKNKGKQYAISCSWKNKAKQWIQDVLISPKKIGIFNSFPFHYEMFGFILEYAKINNFIVDIFNHPHSLHNKDLGWISFYNSFFSGFNVIDYKYFDGHLSNYELFFLTTDDDHNFKKEWITDNVVCLNHFYKIRNYGFKHYLNIAPFKDSVFDYIFPCYDIFKPHQKVLDPNFIDIVIIGTLGLSNTSFNFNRLISNSNKKIRLNIVSRKNSSFNTGSFENSFQNIAFRFFFDMDTQDMIQLVKNSSYILLTATDHKDHHKDHNNLKSSSGAIQLFLSFLCIPIIKSNVNQFFNFKFSIVYDDDDDHLIYLDNCLDFNLLASQRDNYIHKRNLLLDDIIFQNKYCKFNVEKSHTIPKRIVQTWENKNINCDLKSITSSWIDKNPLYSYVFYDKEDRISFLNKYFNNIVLNTYNLMKPGSFKVDLFRLCELYVYGGFYCDIDSLCISSIDNIELDNNTLFSIPIDLNINSAEGTHNLAGGFMLSKNKNPILLRTIHRIINNVINKNIYGSLLDICSSGAIGREVNIFLNRNETTSFINNEGIHTLFDNQNIVLLKFEKDKEYIKNINGDILFQNKNGNINIIQAYQKECRSINNYVNWISQDRDTLFL